MVLQQCYLVSSRVYIRFPQARHCCFSVLLVFVSLFCLQLFVFGLNFVMRARRVVASSQNMWSCSHQPPPGRSTRNEVWIMRIVTEIMRSESPHVCSGFSEVAQTTLNSNSTHLVRTYSSPQTSIFLEVIWLFEWLHGADCWNVSDWLHQMEDKSFSGTFWDLHSVYEFLWLGIFSKYNIYLCLNSSPHLHLNLSFFV